MKSIEFAQQWADPIQAGEKTATELENSILARAREMRIAGAQ